MTHIVLDASVGVKWFRDEAGSTEARELLHRHGTGEITLSVPSLFVYEVMGVAARTLEGPDLEELWVRFLEWRIKVAELDDGLMRRALGVRARTGCTLYDAVAPALAERLGAPLYSADRSAHGSYPGVVILG